MGKYMDYYCTLSLKELRRRQSINQQQTEIAYRAGLNRSSRSLIRLQRIAQLLAAAVYKIYT